MKKAFEYIEGTKPLLISMPHNSPAIPDELESNLTTKACLSEDTDWFIDRLYEFSEDLGVHIIKPSWSRYYIDLNRDAEGGDLYPGMNSTELCPTTNFNTEPLYKNNVTPSPSDINNRIEWIWKPYHQQIKTTLDRMVNDFGQAILFDAHSIRSEVPRFFKGVLPDFNFGTNDGESCNEGLLKGLEEIDLTPYSKISNGRFKGGYITRHYGKPYEKIQAIQLELSQATYMNEDDLSWDPIKAEAIQAKLKSIILYLLNWK